MLIAAHAGRGIDGWRQWVRRGDHVHVPVMPCDLAGVSAGAFTSVRVKAVARLTTDGRLHRGVGGLASGLCVNASAGGEGETWKRQPMFRCDRHVSALEAAGPDGRAGAGACLGTQAMLLLFCAPTIWKRRDVWHRQLCQQHE